MTLSPGFTIAREALSGVFAAAGRLDEQVEQLEALAALEPDRPERDVDLGLAYARVGRTDMAVLALGRAAEEQPGTTTALHGARSRLARHRPDHGRPHRAEQVAGRAPVDSDGNASSEALTLLARALLLAGEVDDATAALQVAAGRFPLDPSAFIELAALAEDEGDAARARQLLIAHDTLAANVPAGQRVERLTRIADLSLELGDPADAVVRFEQARTLEEPSARLLLRLADAEWRAGNHAAARLVIADGLAQYPEDRTLLALQRQFE